MVALSFCALLSACFIESALASWSEIGDISEDYSAIAYVSGYYSGNCFYEEFHQGLIFKGNIYHAAYTDFIGGDPEPYYHRILIETNKTAYMTKYNDASWIATFTDSGYTINDDNIGVGLYLEEP